MREQDKNDEIRLNMESELIRKTLEGDNEAFAELIKGYYRMFYSIAYGYMHNHAEVEDIVQEGVIKIHRNLATLEDPEKFRSWSYTIVRRMCMRALEKKIEETTAISEYEKELTRDQQALNPQELDSPVHHVILDSVMKLPVKIQEVTLLYYFEKLNYQEISERLGVTVRAVEMRLSRARKILRKKIRRNYS